MFAGRHHMHGSSRATYARQRFPPAAPTPPRRIVPRTVRAKASTGAGGGATLRHAAAAHAAAERVVDLRSTLLDSPVVRYVSDKIILSKSLLQLRRSGIE